MSFYNHYMKLLFMSMLSYALACIESNTSNTSETSETSGTSKTTGGSESILMGGRYTVCTVTCEQSKELGYVCYSDITYSYDVWWWFTIVGFFTGLIWSFYCLYAMVMTETKVKVNPQFITIMVNIFVQVIRCIWLLCIFQGRVPGDIIGGIVFESIIIKLGQCLMFTEFFTIILVWKNLVDSSTSMKKLSKEDERRSYYQALLFSLILILAVFPLAILGSVLSPIFGTISNFILLIFVICLLIGGIMYSYKIRKLLANGMKDSKKKDAIRSIMLVVHTFTFLGSLCFVVVILNTFGLLSAPQLKVWVWWFVIHTCEIVLLNLLAYSVSQKARTAFKEHKNIASVYSETNRNTSQVISHK